jgi:hypothetical protein
VRERLEAVERLGRDICLSTVLACQCLASEIGQHLADTSPLSLSPLSDGKEDVIVH